MEREDLHPKLQGMIHFAPMLKQLFPGDPIISISDREKVIYFIGSKVLPIADYTGLKLKPDELMVKVMAEKKPIVRELPKEAYGYAFRTAIAPILTEDGTVVGSVAVTSSLDNQENLISVAQQLAASSEEISASTTEMSTSAQELMRFMDNLTEANKEMNAQMAETEKILELINSIAKSSRILGLNAGIEAARSGEHGRGFSVVAKEITKLADQSANSVDQIQQLIDLVKQKMDHVAKTIEQTFDISENQSNSINEIAQAIHHLTTVAENVEELSRKV